MVQLSLFNDTKPLVLAHVHSSKRGRNERQGVHAWHSYYAGYSEQFTVDVLQCLSKPNDLVLDPWNGSGTTTFAAQKLGLLSLGVEINPVMTIHARAKSLHLVKRSDELLRIRDSLIQKASLTLEKRQIKKTSELDRFAASNVIDTLLSLRDAIFLMLSSASLPEFAENLLTKKESIKYTSDIQAFFLSAIFRVFRKTGSFGKGSNPTWLIIKDPVRQYSREDCLALFYETIDSMLGDLSASFRPDCKTGPFMIVNGDSRDIPIKNSSVDIVITSPPYCTRIDYAVSTKPELLLLGFSDEQFDKLRRATTGAPVIVDKTIQVNQNWGNTCKDFLDSVAKHKSKAARSYYLPNYLQYFKDAFISLSEIARVLKNKGKAAIVVQSSYFKEIELPLGIIYEEMASCLGMQAEIARREVVKQHMAHINNKSSGYLKNKVYFEDVVLLTKPYRNVHYEREKCL